MVALVLGVLVMKSRQDRSLTAAKTAEEQEDSKLGM